MFVLLTNRWLPQLRCSRHGRAQHEAGVHGTIENSADALLQQEQQDIQWRYKAISQDSRYRHYVRIPGRICRCLDYFKISSTRKAVSERLHSYYLFIALVDDTIALSEPGAGQEILQQLDRQKPFFDEQTRASQVRLVTEIFKCHIT